MKEAFASSYGRFGSPLGKVFGPVVAPRTYLRAVHLLAMFPLGLAYFVSLVVSLTVGVTLVWTIIGPVLLIAALFLTRWAGDAEAWLVRNLARIELRRPPSALETGQSARSQIWTRIIDPTTWTGLLYLFAQFPIGVGLFAGLVASSAIAGAFIVAPALVGFFDVYPGFGPQGPKVDTVLEAFALVPIGLLIFLALVHAVNIVSAFHASWAKLMLGTRAKNVPIVPAEAEPSPDGPGEGGKQPLDDSPAPQAAGLLGLESLTPREMEVLGLVARGYSNAEIAEAFVLSEGTVKTHVKRVLAKLNLRGRTQAASFAYEIGFVRAGDRQAVDAPTSLDSRRRSG